MNQLFFRPRSVLFVLILCAMLLTSCAFVDSTDTVTTDDAVTSTEETKPPVAYSKGLEFALREDGSTYALVGIGTCKDKSIAVPDTYQGRPVTAVGDEAFLLQRNLRAVILPEGIERIGSTE